MSVPLERRGRPRVRVRYISGQWHAVAIRHEGGKEIEVSRSPGGTEADAERYLATFREYGAWKKS